MAERPIFVSKPESDELVKEIFFQIKWYSGFALVQKEKNIEELHKAAGVAGYRNLPEISSKSKSERGRRQFPSHTGWPVPTQRQRHEQRFLWDLCETISGCSGQCRAR